MAKTIQQYKKELKALDNRLASASSDYEFQAKVRSNLQTNTGSVVPMTDQQKQRLAAIKNNAANIASYASEARSYIASAIKELDKASGEISGIKSNIKSAKSIEESNVWGRGIDQKNKNKFTTINKKIKSIK